MHQTITKINERRKERRKTEYLLHERTLLMKELEFRKYCSPLRSLKYFTNKKEVPKTKAS